LHWRPLALVLALSAVQLPLIIRFWPEISAMLPIWLGMLGQSMLAILAAVLTAAILAWFATRLLPKLSRHA
jgi:hypothetical protein